jgi:hypothetical protein
MGWAPGGVLTIDADLGISGRFGAHRDGFTELLARLTDALLVDADGVYDLSDVNDRLLLGLKGSMSEALSRTGRDGS